MRDFTPSFECRTARFQRRRLWVLWGACLLPLLPACAQTAPAMNSAHGISSITLESDCSGCATGTRLELQRSGSAVLTRTGKARLRTSDSSARAPLAAADFDALAQRFVAAGFFEMAEAYEEPGLQDGQWATLGAVRQGVPRQVFRREDAGPAALQALLDAVAALQARLVFVPDAR